MDQIVLVDMLMPIVATSFDAPSLIAHLLCIPLYVVSFMCIYEIGYYENDTKSASKEITPALTPQVEQFVEYRMEPYAWLYSVAFGATGGLLTVFSGLTTPDGAIIASIIWFGLLIAARIVFYVYNGLPVADRIGLYLVLQLLKYGGLLLLFKPTTFGAVTVCSQILMMSVVYWIYRAGGDQRSINKELMRLAFAATVGIPVLMSRTMAANDTLTAATLALTWLVLRLSKPPVMATLRGRLGRDQSR